MQYIQKVNVPATVKEVPHFVSRCLHCGCDKIEIEEYNDDRSPPVSTATCTGCTQKHRIDPGGIKAVIELWNKNNDIDILIADSEKSIEEARELSIALKNLKTLRIINPSTPFKNPLHEIHF